MESWRWLTRKPERLALGALPIYCHKHEDSMWLRMSRNVWEVGRFIAQTLAINEWGVGEWVKGVGDLRKKKI